MEIKAKTRTEQILVVMTILAYVALVGYSIEAGAMIISYLVTTFNAEGAGRLYQGLDMQSLREHSFWHYTLSLSYRIAIAMMKAYVSYLAIKTLQKVKLENPFQSDVAQMIEKISHMIFATWIIAMVHNAHANWLQHRDGVLPVEFISGEFIFAAALLFVVAQIFKRGVEIQKENDLTV
jgi:hypothetical protein